MKIRQGFVSNSSTSSFIVLAFEAPSLTKEQRKMYFDKNVLLTSDDRQYIGKYLAYASVDMGWTIFEADKFFTKLHAARQITLECAKELNVDPSEIKIFYGVQYEGGIREVEEYELDDE
jgi:hypothetical protein